MNYTIAFEKREFFIAVLKGVISKNLNYKIENLWDDLKLKRTIYNCYTYGSDKLINTDIKVAIFKIADKADLDSKKDIPQELIYFLEDCFEEAKTLCN